MQILWIRDYGHFWKHMKSSCPNCLILIQKSILLCSVSILHWSVAIGAFNWTDSEQVDQCNFDQSFHFFRFHAVWSEVLRTETIVAQCLTIESANSTRFPDLAMHQLQCIMSAKSLPLSLIMFCSWKSWTSIT